MQKAKRNIQNNCIETICSALVSPPQSIQTLRHSLSITQYHMYDMITHSAFFGLCSKLTAPTPKEYFGFFSYNLHNFEVLNIYLLHSIQILTKIVWKKWIFRIIFQPLKFLPLFSGKYIIIWWKMVGKKSVFIRTNNIKLISDNVLSSFHSLYLYPVQLFYCCDEVVCEELKSAWCYHYPTD